MIKHNDNACGIYAIINTTNNKFYIGSSKSIYYRTRRHLSDLRKNRHKNPILQNSFNKYKEESFKWLVIDICKEEELQNLEKYYIDTLKPIFNIQQDPIRQPKTKETRKKISKSLKEGYDKGTIKPTRTRGVVAYSHTGEIFHFKQVKECIKELNLSTTRVYAVLKNEQPHTKGYQIFYSDEKEHNLVQLDLQIGNSGYLESDIQTRYQKPVARLKSCELLENPEEDNQQPSLSGDILEGSETRSESQVDNNSPKSAGQSIIIEYDKNGNPLVSVSYTIIDFSK